MKYALFIVGESVTFNNITINLAYQILQFCSFEKVDINIKKYKFKFGNNYKKFHIKNKI